MTKRQQKKIEEVGRKVWLIYALKQERDLLLVLVLRLRQPNPPGTFRCIKRKRKPLGWGGGLWHRASHAPTRNRSP